jgi:hypothetical protein
MGPIRHTPDPEMFKDGARALEWLPVRLSSSHLCTDRTLTFMFVRSSMLVAGKYVRARFRLHEGTSRSFFGLVARQHRFGHSHPLTPHYVSLPLPGTHTEVQYSLMTFGIPIYMFPMTSDGELKLANHLKWIKKRQVKETLLTSFGFFDKVDMPKRNDILVGKGKPFQQHPGNVRLRHLVELRLADYTVARKSEKTNLTKAIVQMIKDSSVRFLKRDLDGWWEEVSDEDAREKVSKTFGSTRVSSVKTLQNHGPGILASGNQKRAKIETDGWLW